MQNEYTKCLHCLEDIRIGAKLCKHCKSKTYLVLADEIKFRCLNCGQKLSTSKNATDQTLICPTCNINVSIPEIKENTDESALRESTSFIEKFTELMGLKSISGVKYSEIFSEVFNKHEKKDAENIFACGTEQTTPDINNLDFEVPKPWLFFRVLVLSLITYFLFDYMWEWFQNPKVVPGVIITGTFAIPISVLVLFFELNIRKDLSFYRTAKILILGGVLSILVTLFINDTPIGKALINKMSASSAGPIEEIAKLFIVYYFLKGMKEKHILSALLIGAAVGTGFSAFESAGYAFERLALSQSYESMEEMIKMRGLLSPFMHTTWTAIASAGLCIAFTNYQAQGGRLFTNARFLKLLGFSIACHMYWNSTLLTSWGIFRYAPVAILVWIVILSLVLEGIDELKRKKHAG